MTTWTSASRSSGSWRFVRAGVQDATNRLSRLTAQRSLDEAPVVRLLTDSAVVRFVARIATLIDTAARTSVAVRAIRAASASWRPDAPSGTRDRGIALVTAASAFVGLSIWRPPLAGWLWLVPPGIALAIGGLMALAPSAGAPRGGQRP